MLLPVAATDRPPENSFTLAGTQQDYIPVTSNEHNISPLTECFLKLPITPPTRRNAQADKQKPDSRATRQGGGLSTNNVENIQQNRGTLNAATFTIRDLP